MPALLIRQSTGPSAASAAGSNACTSSSRASSASALSSNERGDPYVWIVERPAMTVSRRSVTIGELSGDQVEILDGLQGTETVAISAAQNLRDGMVVREIAY